MSNIGDRLEGFLVHQFLRACYFVFILAGIVCALVSAFIEYEVFAGLYQKLVVDREKYLSLSLNFLSIPFMIVFALEVTKVFSVFLDKQYRSNHNDRYMESRPFFVFLRRTLVLVSGLCTLIFSFYNLHNPEYQNQLNRAIGELRTAHDEKLKNLRDGYNIERERINEEFEQQKDKQFKEDQKDVDYWKKLMDEERENVQNGVWRGRVYKSYEAEWEKCKDRQMRNQREIESDRLTKVNDLEASYNKSRESLRENLDSEITEAKEKQKEDLSSDNKLISAFLQVVNMAPNYPRWQYILSIFLISLLLTLSLEGIIIATFTLLAIKHGDLFEFSLDTNINEELYKGAVRHSVGLDDIDKESFRSMLERRVKETVKSIRNMSKKLFNRRYST